MLDFNQSGNAWEQVNGNIHLLTTFGKKFEWIASIRTRRAKEGYPVEHNGWV